jgi:hypothetical protein
MPTQTFSGARALFHLNNYLIGWAGGVSGEEVVDYQPIDVLGQLAVREHVPVAYRTSLSAQVFRIINSPLKRFRTEDGSSFAVFPKEAEILQTDGYSATITDKLNDGIVAAQFEGVKASGHTFDTSARGIVSENISFVAIRLKDESEIS